MVAHCDACFVDPLKAVADLCSVRSKPRNCGLRRRCFGVRLLDLLSNRFLSNEELRKLLREAASLSSDANLFHDTLEKCLEFY